MSGLTVGKSDLVLYPNSIDIAHMPTSDTKNLKKKIARLEAEIERLKKKLNEAAIRQDV